jgi:hypothetical protein
MPSGVFSHAPSIPPFKSQDIMVDDKGVLFSNFVVNSILPLQSHRDFIRDSYVPFVILQIDLLGYRDNEITFFVKGSASATGTTDGNQALSDGRAKAIGQVVKHFFDLQKGGSNFAKAMSVKIVPIGYGDQLGRDLLDGMKEATPGLHLTSAEIEKLEYGCRSAHVDLNYAHVADDDDEEYLCQQVFNATLNTKKVPANHLEELLDSADAKLGKFGSWVAGLGFSQLKKYLIKQLKETIKPMFEDFPEIAIVYESIDFITPGDVFLCFRIKDHMGKIAQYQFTGTQNKKSFDIFDVLSSLISMVRWMTKIQEALEKADNLAGGLEKSKKVIENLKKSTEYLKKGIEDLLKKDGLIRKYCGDSFADMLLSILQAGVNGPLIIEASDWFRVVFVTPSVYQVDSFSSTARIETREFLGKARVDLQFLGAGPEGRLGWGAETIIHTDFTIQTGILGWGSSKGALRIMP